MGILPYGLRATCLSLSPYFLEFSGLKCRSLGVRKVPRGF